MGKPCRHGQACSTNDRQAVIRPVPKVYYWLIPAANASDPQPGTDGLWEASAPRHGASIRLVSPTQARWMHRDEIELGEKKNCSRCRCHDLKPQ